MIYNFPKAYEDEIFYSIVARYVEYFGNSGPKQLLGEMFSTNLISATIDFPTGLNAFTNNVRSSQYEADTIISRHTLYPLFARFLDTNRNSKIMTSMLTSSGNIHTRVGLNAGISKPPKMPRFCIKCYREDLSKYGESYFRRIHQLVSVHICSIHYCMLEELPLIEELINKHLFISASVIEKLPLKEAVINESKEIQRISERLSSLVNPEVTHLYNGDKYFYNSRLKELGYSKGQRSLDLLKLYDAFQQHFSTNTLNHFSSNVDFSDPSCWFKLIVRKHRKAVDPLRHVLLEDFILNYNHSIIKKAAILTCSWPCLNPVCEHFKKEVINQYETHKDRKSGKEIRYLECECGYGYTESLIEPDGKYFRRVKNYGQEWINELHRLNFIRTSIRKIGIILGCDSKTVKHHLLSFQDKKQSLSRLNAVKRAWSKLVRSNSELSITQLRDIKPAAYSFLYRNDKKWLKGFTYPEAKTKSEAKIDWKRRDEEILCLLKEKHNYLKVINIKRRISSNLLLALIGKQALFEKSKENLPRVSSFLTSVVESKEDHRIRRLHMAAEQMYLTQNEVKRWLLLRKAGIRREYLSEAIEIEIQEIMQHQESHNSNKLIA